jgi:hypothetical protein
MAADASQFEELGRLIAALLDGGLEPSDRRRLEEMLLGDPAAATYYQDYLDVHVLLHWQQGLAEEQPACGESGTRERGRVAEGISPVSAETSAEPVSSAGGRPIHPPNFILHPLAALESLAGSAAFSYLVAAVLLGAGILLAGAWQTGVDSSSLARAKTEAAKAAIASPVFVARITKAQNCYREDGGPWGADGPLVRLGFQCYVKAGDLEITYNTGTKVTLQGPAFYEVSAPDGGSLFEGSAVVCVEAHQGALPVKTAATAKEIASHPLFTLRTPVGLLTNQAAEFSLTVDETWAFFARVRRGQVALQMPGWSPDEAVAIQNDHSAVTFIRTYSTGGFQWELHLSGDQPLMVDSNPQRPKPLPVVFSGEHHGSVGKWGLEKRPRHSSGS